SVGRHHAGFIVNAAQPLVAPTFHHPVRAGHADVIAAVVADPTLDRGHGVAKVDDADANPENVDPIVPELISSGHAAAFLTSILASLKFGSRKACTTRLKNLPSHGTFPLHRTTTPCRRPDAAWAPLAIVSAGARIEKCSAGVVGSRGRSQAGYSHRRMGYSASANPIATVRPGRAGAAVRFNGQRWSGAGVGDRRSVVVHACQNSERSQGERHET